VRTIAFYLPQFHSIPENDSWWGPGFTEWTNVDRARPFFEGHRQPRIPSSLGRYSLLDPTTLARQSDLARLSGVDGFCIYYYWFDGRRLLEKPLDMWSAGENLLPYCLSWANESWTRRWDGKHREVLMAQTYPSGFEEELFADLLPHFRNARYLRVGNRPILVVHRPTLIPHPRLFAQRLRALALASGLPGLHLVGAETLPNLRPGPLGLDAVAEFPPVGANTLRTVQLRPVRGLDRSFRGRLMSYDRLMTRYLRRREPSFVRYSGVVPGWDNTARRMGKATIYHGETPQAFARWITHARLREQRLRGGEGLVFVNAWNEWAEGAYLEPDDDFADSFLHASRGRETHPKPRRESGRPGRFWSYPQLRSVILAAGGSAVSAHRSVANVFRRLSA